MNARFNFELGIGDQVNNTENNKTKNNFVPNDLSFVKQGFDKRHKECTRRKANESERNIDFHGFVKKHPVQGNDGPDAKELQQALAACAYRGCFESEEYENGECGNQGAVPNQVKGTDADQFAEDGGPAPDKDNEMK